MHAHALHPTHTHTAVFRSLPTPPHTHTHSASKDLDERRQQAEVAKAAVEAAKDKLTGLADQLADAAHERAKLLANLEKWVAAHAGGWRGPD